MAPLLSSMVAGHAIERRVPGGLRVLLAVALDAPAHREGPRRGPGAPEAKEGDGKRRSGVGRKSRHRLDVAMTALALEPRADVRLVRKVRELRQLVHADPGDRFLLRVKVGELLDLGLVRRGDLVTPHAALHRGKPGVLRAARVAVTVLAIDLVGTDVNAVREVDGLHRGFRGGGRLTAPR